MKTPQPTNPIQPKPVQQIRQTALIIVGVVVILFAVFNLLFDLGVVSQDDLETLRVRFLYTATPPVVVQYRPIAGTTGGEQTPQATDVTVTATSQATPVLITTEDSGFLPLQIEQGEIESGAAEY